MRPATALPRGPPGGWGSLLQLRRLPGGGRREAGAAEEPGPHLQGYTQKHHVMHHVPLERCFTNATMVLVLRFWS